MDAREFDRPVNYALVRIRGRREDDFDHTEKNIGSERKRGTENKRDRRKAKAEPGEGTDFSRPIVIIDPRAGHGPGIGGSKQESQIGMALNAGHPVYFVIFFTDPEPGQTLADVHNVQIQFVEEVRSRHLDTPKPAIIGNCQGGWAAALIGSERPDLVGPMVFNGSPLSYWGGVQGMNPMRYLGGLLGGAWINSYISDLGGGKFDGANLVANFENLNPGNTLWAKHYHLYANIDSEEDRYLNFEKWWGGFFLLNKREIHTIVNGLFVGNRLEQGEFELEDGNQIYLKHNNNPVVVFASFGDNITSPQQAFNWIIKTYGTVEEIKRRGQVIVCIGHETIGHLGIFVSAKIALKEHKEIIASFDILDYLPPGLYQMRIKEDDEVSGQYTVDYVEKNMEDIMALDDGLEDEDAFFPARALSQINDSFYQLFVSPWVKMAGNSLTAEMTRQLNPLRSQRYLLSNLNPWMIPFQLTASMINHNGSRKQVNKDNIFSKLEKHVSSAIEKSLNEYRDIRDSTCEQVFKVLYENTLMKLFTPITSAEKNKQAEIKLEALRRKDASRWIKLMGEGGFSEAMVRIFLAIGLADRQLSPQGFVLLNKLVKDNARMKGVTEKDLQQILHTQARIIQTDTEKAIDTLDQLLPTKTARRDARSMLNKGVRMVPRDLDPREKSVLDKIRLVLKD